jgi:O-methyltransferase involved in polyketide biosynthesis
MYDYALGGKENFPADREAVHRLIAVNPVFTFSCRANRDFVGRAVLAAVAAGIRQFLDIGSGLPTQQNVHQIARVHAPESRVVYCDYDPLVVAHTRALLSGVDNTWIIERDVRDPDGILGDPVVRAAIDFGEPLAILVTMLLHWVPDRDRPGEIVARLAGAAAPGSYLVLTHGTAEWHPPEQIRQARRVYDDAREEVTYRTVREVAGWFEGMDLLPPGLVPVAAWRPDDPADAAGATNTGIMAAVAVTRPPAGSGCGG